jgi:hypothetical protein
MILRRSEAVAVTVGPFLLISFVPEVADFLVKTIFFFVTEDLVFVGGTCFALGVLLLSGGFEIGFFTTDFEEFIPSPTDCFGPAKAGEPANSRPPKLVFAVVSPEVDERCKPPIPGALGPTKCGSAIPLLINPK